MKPSSRPHSQRGISLIEVMLAIGAMTLLSGAAFAIYQSSANNADVRAEQANIHTIARNADMTYGALGSYAGLTTAQAIADRVPPVSMNSGVGLTSRWAQPVILEPATIDGRPNAGLKIVYHAVPTRACLKLAAAASGGMYDLEIDDTSVFNRGNNHRPTILDIQAATQRCRNAARLAFTYYGGATGLSAQVLTPVALPPPPPTSAPPPPAPVVAPPPVAVTPPAPSPGCAAAPTAPATGTTPAGQTCSFIWNSVAAPACWSPLALCVPIAAQSPIPTAPPAPPAVTPPIVPPVITPVCSAPLPLSESAAQTGFCPSGTITISGATSFPQTRTRTTTYSCPDPFASPIALTGPWSAWLPAAASICAPACTPAPPISVAITRAAPAESQNVGCPAGQAGQHWQQRNRVENGTRTTSWSCPAATGSPVSSTSESWSGTYTASSGWVTTSNTCTPPAPPARTYPTYTGKSWISWGDGGLYGWGVFCSVSQFLADQFHCTQSVNTNDDATFSGGLARPQEQALTPERRTCVAALKQKLTPMPGFGSPSTGPVNWPTECACDVVGAGSAFYWQTVGASDWSAFEFQCQ